MYGIRYTKRQEVSFLKKYKPEISFVLMVFGIVSIVALIFVLQHFIAA